MSGSSTAAIMAMSASTHTISSKVKPRYAPRPAHQRRQAFRRRGKPARIEIEQVERAAEALQLNLCGLDFRFAEIIENARADQPHDEADDGDHHQHLHEREALLAPVLTAPIVCAPGRQPADACYRLHDEPTLALSDKLRNRQKCGHDRYDQPPDDRTDGDDRKRPDDADDSVKAALQLRLIELGDPARQHG